ncbi:MAG: NAD(P)-dependent oxidoreductase [Nitrososphaerota archaeon]|nr:NAD(P)-dependent oxidoreductase [Candidatus Calditenuaceae archaeon]MDW8072940.1 NAD(P)-dependent oxidoreductase [Nitrososphaerota archaeon]
MPILVTGACGFIGSWTVRRLLELGEKVVLTDVSSDLSRLRFVVDGAEKLPFVKGDVVEEGFIDMVVERFDVDAIIHLAAFQIPQCRADPVGGALVNVIGTLRVFEAAKRHRDRVRRVVYASSAAVFGPPELYGPGPVSVNVPLRPTTHYGAYKVCNELTANAYWHESGIPSIGLRPQVVYGFGRDVGVTSDASRAVKAAVAQRPYKIRFGGMIDMQYVEDVAHLFAVAATRELEGARVYNVRGDVIRVEELVQIVEEVTGVRGLLTFEDRPLPIPADLDDSETMHDLGPLKKTSVREGIGRTAEFFRRLMERGELDLSDVA